MKYKYNIYKTVLIILYIAIFYLILSFRTKKNFHEVFYTKNNTNKDIILPIPKIVYYTHENENKRKQFIKQINISKRNNKNYQFIFYDAIKRANFIKKHFIEFYEFYQRINSEYGAAKADIFRVLVLYKYGGIYIDCKSILKNMDELFQKYPNKDLYITTLKKADKICYYFFL